MPTRSTGGCPRRRCCTPTGTRWTSPSPTDGSSPQGDRPGADGGRAANETTITDWDPVSKQPLFKTAAARIALVARADGHRAPAPTTTASAPADGASVPPTTGGPEAVAAQRADAPEGDGS